MKATIIQTDLQWQDKEANLQHLSAMLDSVPEGDGVVILPEMFTTAFSMSPAEFAESMDGPSVSWMKARAAACRYALCGSLIIAEEDSFFNRMLFVTPDGTVTWYDKRHLHSMSGEPDVYSRGNKRVTCIFRELRFNLQVCYDLRFPVWSRNRGDTDVIIYSANWPDIRSHAWKSLLVARAIENQCYVIGVNRVGKNPDGTSYSGDSVIIGPRGEQLAFVPSGEEGIASAELSLGELEKYRSDMPIWRDADAFTIL